ncbi:MAG: hypothetical protein AAF919_06695 [Pseudomonadota bacterium]
MTETPDQHRPPLSPEAATSMALALGVASMVAATMLFGLFGIAAAEARLIQLAWVILAFFGTIIGFVLLSECTPKRRMETALGRRMQALVEWIGHVLHIVGVAVSIAAVFSVYITQKLDWFAEIVMTPIVFAGAYLALLPGAVLVFLAVLEGHAASQSS